MSKYEEIYNRIFDIPEEKRKELGNLIRSIREKQNMTMQDICEKSRVSLSDLHKIEYGTKIKINALQLKEIGKALNVDYRIMYQIVGYLDKEELEIHQLNQSEDDLIFTSKINKIVQTLSKEQFTERGKELLKLFETGMELSLVELKNSNLYIEFLRQETKRNEEEKNDNKKWTLL